MPERLCSLIWLSSQFDCDAVVAGPVDGWKEYIYRTIVI
jgi:hypothetical protein